MFRIHTFIGTEGKTFAARGTTNEKRGKQKRSVVYFFTVALFISSLLIVSEGAPAGPPTKPDVRIGIVAPLTGMLANMGSYITQGVELAVNEINKAGGVGGSDVNCLLKILVEGVSIQQMAASSRA